MLGKSALRVCGTVQLSAIRSVSSKYPRPKPRPYRRRLFEAAVAPVLPEKLSVCTPKVFNRGGEAEYDEVELALCRLVKKWMISQEFRVLAVCQFLPVPGRTLWLTKNQLRMKGLEFRSYGNRIMRKVFEGTPLSALNPVLVETNAMLFGKDLSVIKTINDEAEKINWLFPLACVADSRILSMEEVKQISKVGSLNDHRVETVQILTSQIGQLPQTLDSPSLQLTSALDQIASRSS
ncbi:Mitochondrial Ribosomal Protein Large [Trichostrongylus colubriformis]|uniref:Large ribosomal subunit protein uL10m n=1 Tax=Trichostrongylus colubriformis TaxID=6319 RepID=A0AAN8IMJ2_TRICO